MRFYYFVVLFFILSVTLPASAQLNIGLVSGLNYAKLEFEGFSSEYSHKYRTRLGLGVVFNFELNKHLSLHLEPMYLQKGSTFEEANNAYGPKLKQDLSYFEVPLFLKTSFGKKIKPYALTGPTFGFLLSSESNLLGTNGGNANMKSVTRNIDLGIDFGGGISILVGKIRIFLESHYTLVPEL